MRTRETTMPATLPIPSLYHASAAGDAEPLPVIHLTWDEARALHQAGANGWGAGQALSYLAQQARACGEDARALDLLGAAASL